MRWSIISELFKVNILYSNPQMMAAIRQKREKYPHKVFSTYKSVLQRQFLNILLFTLLYCYMFLGINYRDLPGVFSTQLAMFIFMTVTSAFGAMFSIFYDSKDLPLYAHMPISSKEIFIAKIFSSLGVSSMFLMPLLSLLLITYWQLLGVLGIILGVFVFFVLLAETLLFSLYLVHLSGRFLLRFKYRKGLVSVLMLGMTFVGIFVLSAINGSQYTEDYAKLPVFIGFYDIAISPFSSASLVNFWLPLLIIGFMTWHLFKSIMPNYYRFALNHAKPQQNSKQKKASKNTANTLLIKHHLTTIKNPTILSSTFLPPLMLLLSPVGAILGGDMKTFSSIPLIFWSSFVLAGIMLGVLSNNPQSAIGYAISLERENYTFIKTLPITHKSFLWQKFWTIWLVQNLVPISLYCIALSFLKLPLLLLVAFVFGALISGSLMGQMMFKRDMKHLSLNWQEVTQLISRDGASWLVGLIAMVTFILAIASIVISVLATIAGFGMLVSSIIVLSSLAIGIPLQWHLATKFWKTL